MPLQVGISHPEPAVLRFCVSDRQRETPGHSSGHSPGRATGQDYCFATLPVAALRSGYRSLPLRDKNGCLVAFSTLLLHVRQTHTHLPPSLRREERDGRHRAEGAERLASLVEAKQKRKPGKGILASLGKSAGKGPSLEA